MGENFIHSSPTSSNWRDHIERGDIRPWRRDGRPSIFSAHNGHRRYHNVIPATLWLWSTESTRYWVDIHNASVIVLLNAFSREPSVSSTSSSSTVTSWDCDSPHVQCNITSLPHWPLCVPNNIRYNATLLHNWSCIHHSKHYIVVLYNRCQAHKIL